MSGSTARSEEVVGDLACDQDQDASQELDELQIAMHSVLPFHQPCATILVIGMCSKTPMQLDATDSSQFYEIWDQNSRPGGSNAGLIVGADNRCAVQDSPLGQISGEDGSPGARCRVQ